MGKFLLRWLPPFLLGMAVGVAALIGFLSVNGWWSDRHPREETHFAPASAARSSAYCAAWAAVDAYEHANQLSLINIEVAGFQFIALLSSLLLTARASQSAARVAEATESSVQISREIADRQLRPYLYFERPQLADFDAEHPRRLEIKLTLRNEGQTPAHSVQFSAATALVDYPLRAKPFGFDYKPAWLIRTIGPRQDRNRFLGRNVRTELASGEKVLLLKYKAVYKLSRTDKETDTVYGRLLIDRRSLEHNRGRRVQPSDYAEIDIKQDHV